MRKSKIIILIILCIILLTPIVQASTIGVVNSNSNNYILNSDMKFTKKIVNYDEENQEIEIELSLKNIKKNEKDIEDIEVAIVLDNSGSMSQVENNESKKDTTYKAAQKFISLLYDNIKKLEVAITQYSDGSRVISTFTDSKQTALNGLDNYKNTACNGGTNTHTALEMAKSQFRSNCKNKVIVLVTDGYPNSPENTKKELEKLEAQGIYLLSIIVSDKTGIAQIQNIFGTEEEPTAGDVHYIENSNEIYQMFNEYLYNQILNYMEHPITNVKIEDVFPEELLKYFDVEYIDKPDKGSVTDIGENNSFVWSIDSITGDEIITFKYKIKIKKGVNIDEIKNFDMKTNEKVIINYTDEDGKDQAEIFDDNPVIKIKDEKNPTIDDLPDRYKTDEYIIVNITGEETPTPSSKPTSSTPNNTKKPSTQILPQTGIEDLPIVILIGSILISVGFGIRWAVVERIAKGK